MISGSEIYDNILKGTEEKGGMIPFVKSLNETIEKQNKIIKELEEELNHKTGKVSSRSIKSNNVKEIESSKNNNENLNEWFKNRLQGR